MVERLSLWTRTVALSSLARFVAAPSSCSAQRFLGPAPGSAMARVARQGSEPALPLGHLTA